MTSGGYDVVVVGSGYGGSVVACRLVAAGVDVCLIERGRRWAAGDFPTNVVGLLLAVRVDSRNWGVILGRKDALFQIHEQGDSLAVVACGLGGGSLINAGLIARHLPERRGTRGGRKSGTKTGTPAKPRRRPR
ncbi:hypothetical protein QJS10_CPB19g00420 [Acorus calamus]|uniref:Uncharacterized protein n=1 Tax=Acorus calamus TaxID=4465 RepID=A0AAV9CJU5_ACOCL|nr:hypothetical protein QJS10_CPB19g00420 [Acorus calamus]